MNSLNAVKRITERASQIVRHPFDLRPYPRTINDTTEALRADIDTEIMYTMDVEEQEDGIVQEGTRALNTLGNVLLGRSGQLLAWAGFSLFMGTTAAVGAFAPEYLLKMGKVPELIKIFGSMIAGAGLSFFTIDSYYAFRNALIGRDLANFHTD